MKMKLLFSAVFVCTLLTTSYAQINKGSVWLGSNLSYSQTKDRPEQSLTDREVKTLSILPSFGMAIQENLVLGIFGNYTDAHTENDGYLVDRKDKTYGGGVFVRRYIPVFNRFYLFGEGRLGYNALERKEKWSSGSYVSNKTKGSETTLSFTPGVSYGITQNIQLEAAFSSLFGAKYQTTKYDQVHKSSSFNAGVSLENVSAFSIGVRFLINKKA